MALQAPVHVVVLGRVPVRLGLPARLVAVGLQEGVLVAVQVVHQVPVAAVLRDDVDGPWGGDSILMSFVPRGCYGVAGCLARAMGKSCFSDTECFWDVELVSGKAGGINRNMPAVPSTLEREASEPHKAFLGEGQAVLNQKSGLTLSLHNSPPALTHPLWCRPPAG